MAERKHNWQEAPIVHVDPPKCPWCGSSNQPIRCRSVAEGDGSLAWLSLCRDCSQPFQADTLDEGVHVQSSVVRVDPDK